MTAKAVAGQSLPPLQRQSVSWFWKASRLGEDGVRGSNRTLELNLCFLRSSSGFCGDFGPPIKLIYKAKPSIAIRHKRIFQASVLVCSTKGHFPTAHAVFRVWSGMR